ncbi:type II secretion system F family protein [Ornithinimicrobium sufpigmenti]|uniref:type II secretion system F family protein n=1 Tax=Ornithinimicrobium sufpigmenti TaxID=2508882 RepID=UPI001035C3D7|nr:MULTISPECIES: type II secretion system F family protein [unclassified Ornithinimicrobium]
MMLLLPALCGLLAAAAVLVWTQASPPQAPAGARTAGSTVPSRPGETSRQGGWSSGAVAPAPRTSVREDVRRLLRRAGVGRAERRRDLELQVLDGLAAALEAGLPVPQAVTLAVTQVDRGSDRQDDAHAGEWDELARAAREGQALGQAWHRLARRTGSPTLHSVARAWRVATLTGAPLAGAIRVSAHASRERRRLERAVQVTTAGARATVTVLTLLPLAGVGLAAVLGVSPASLYSHPVALTGAGAGVALIIIGQAWSRRLVGRVLHALT